MSKERYLDSVSIEISARCLVLVNSRVFLSYWHIKEMDGEHLTEEKLTQMTPLFQELIQKERELSHTHYQVVTAQDSNFLAYQLILKGLYQSLYNENFDAYEFLRPYHDPELTTNLEQFLGDHPDLIEIGKVYSIEEELDEEVYEEYKTTKESDSLPTIRRQLISASLTLETWSPFDSALHVLAHGSGMSQKAEKEVLKELLKGLFKISFARRECGLGRQALKFVTALPCLS